MPGALPGSVQVLACARLQSPLGSQRSTRRGELTGRAACDLDLAARQDKVSLTKDVYAQGPDGGPSEENTTSLLVRSTASKWAKGSLLAVDAGTHLAAIVRQLEKNFPLVSSAPVQPQSSPSDAGSDSPTPGVDGNTPRDDNDNHANVSTRTTTPDPHLTTLSEGPFAGLPFPYLSARANAAHVMREYVSTYLITHPHLDHLSGLVINTAALQNTSRPKRVAALPFTVDAMKRHLFNDVIWPNLTDEDGGVGLVTFQRLQDGGNIALGEGFSSGYIEICDGLSVRGFTVSHGHCMKGPGHVHRGSNGDLRELGPPQRQASQVFNLSSSASQQQKDGPGPPNETRSLSFSIPSQPTTPTFFSAGSAAAVRQQQQPCVVDSSAYFIRASPSGREVLIFGDVEPDSVSLVPRNVQIWSEAAPKIAAGLLRAIFIECSYNDGQSDAMLYGHLAPRHLIQELQNLAELVTEARKDYERQVKQRPGHKRKRTGTTLSLGANQAASSSPMLGADDSSRVGSPVPMASLGPSAAQGEDDVGMPDAPLSASLLPVPDRNNSTPATAATAAAAVVAYERPLRGVKVVVIHVKDTLTDGPLVGDSILEQLQEYEEKLTAESKALGCTFEISKAGGSYWF